MSYTGDVTVGGPADSRELPGLTISKVAVGPMNNNAYLLRCTSTGELLLIDAANEAGTLLGLLGGMAAHINEGADNVVKGVDLVIIDDELTRVFGGIE